MTTWNTKDVTKVVYQPPGGGKPPKGKKPPKGDTETLTDEPEDGEGSGESEEPEDDESEDGESEDGESEDGESEDGETSEGKPPKTSKTSKGKPKDETSKGESEDGETSETSEDGESDGETPESDTTAEDLAKVAEKMREALEGRTKTITEMLQEDAAKGSEGHCKFEGIDQTQPDPEIYYPEAKLSDARSLVQIGNRWMGPGLERLQVLLMAQDSRRTYRDRKSGHLDAGRIHRLETTSSGEPPRIFTKEERGIRKDAAITILVDQSGSMSSHRRHIIATALMASLGQLLERLRVPSEIIGYSGSDSAYYGGSRKAEEPVQWTVYKTFDEPNFNLSRVEPVARAGNGDYDTLKRFIPRLLGRKEPKKILFVLVDGIMTSGPGNPTISVRRQYEFAKKKGIRVFGFGMGLNVSEIFGSDWVRVPDSAPGDFAQKLINKLSEVLSD